MKQSQFSRKSRIVPGLDQACVYPQYFQGTKNGDKSPVMSCQLEEHFKLGVQACLKGFVKDANIQGNIVISKYLLKIDVCMLLGVV